MHGDERHEHNSDDRDHRLDFGAQHEARRHRRRGDEIGRVLAGDREPGETAGELTCRHHQHRNEEIDRSAAGLEAPPQQNCRRHEIKHLHQRLRHQPRVAAQQDPFLAPQRMPRRWRRGKSVRPRRPADLRIAGARRGDGIFAEARRRRSRRSREQDETESHHAGERRSVAERRPGRPPHHAVDIGRQLPAPRPIAARRCATTSRRTGSPPPASRSRRRRRSPRRRSAPPAACASGRWCETARPSAPRQARSRQRPWRRSRRKRRAQCQPPTHDHHVDERRGERQRHRRDRQRDGRDAHGENLVRGDRRGQDEIEIGARVESARHRFHGLRNHQQPRHQQASR